MTVKPRWTLASKMAALTLAILVPSLVAGAAVALIAVRHQAETAARAEAHEQVERLVRQVDGMLAAMRLELVSQAECNYVRDQDAGAIYDEFSRLVPQLPYLLDLSVSLPDGQLLAAARLGVRSGVSVAAQDQFQRARETGDFAIGQIIPGQRTGRPVLVASYPYCDRSGNFGGAVSAALDLEYLQSSLAEMAPIEGSRLGILTDSGAVIAMWPAEADASPAEPPELVQYMYTTPYGTWDGLFPDGIQRLAGFSSSDTFGWRAFVAIPASVAYAPVQGAAAKTGVFFLALALVAAYGTLVISRRLSRPLLALSAASEELASGHLPRTLPLGSDDEMGRLTAAFNAMAKQVSGTAAANADLIRSQRETLAKLETLQSLTDAAISTLDLDDLLGSLLDRSIRTLSADGGAILMVDEKGGALRIRASQGIPPEILANYERRLGEGISGRAAAERKSLAIHDVAAEPDLPAPLSRRRGVRSVLAVPLVGRARTIGVLRLDGRQPGQFTREHLRLMEVAAERMALAIENAALLREARDLAAENARLYGETDERLRTSLQELRVLLASMNEGMFATDLRGGIIAMNEWLAAILGCQVSQTADRHFREVIRPQDASGNPAWDEMCPVQSALDTGEPSDPETVFLYPPQGQRLAVSVSAAPMRGTSGDVTGCVVMVRDVTREWEIDKLKTEIISVVSHEFRTPLTSIVGFSELMMMREQDEDERRISLHHIHEEGVRLESLVNDFLDISRLESGRLEMRIEPMDPAMAISRSLEALASQTDGRSVTVDAEPGLLVLADPRRLDQIVTNLLSNALKYSSKGSPVTLRTRAIDGRLVPGMDAGEAASGWAVLSVEDHGIGIPEEEVALLFTPFHRVDNLRTRSIRGTGLGLSIVKELTHLHGGKVWVESTVGVGSKFHVALRSAAPLPLGEGRGEG